MRTTRLVMIAPFRGRRRTSGTRSRRESGVDRSSFARWRRGRRSRTSSPVGDRRGCRSRRPGAGRPVDDDVVAVDLDPRAQGAQAGDDPGDPVGFLVAQLARAADDGRAARLRWPRGTGPGSRRSRRPSSAGAELDGPERRRAHGQVRDRLADAVALGEPSSSAVRSSIDAPIDRRMSMTARRVGLTPTSRERELGVRMDRAGDQPEGSGRRRRPGTRSVAAPRRAAPPSISTTAADPSGASRPLDRARPARAASAPCGRASRPPRGPSSCPSAAKARQQDRRLHLRATAPASSSRSPAAGYDRSRSTAGGIALPASSDGAHRPQRLDDTGHRAAAQRSVAVEDRASIGRPARMPREQAQARPGVAAVERPVGRARPAPSAPATRRRSRRVGPSLPTRSTVAAERLDDPGRRADVRAVARAR